MRFINRLIKYFTPFEWFLVLGIIAFNVVYSVFNHDIDFVGSAAAIAGVLCVVLVAKRSMWNYLFGVINVSLYAYISFKASIYGDAFLNALYYLPMQFIGWSLWKKRLQADDQDKVKSRKMSLSQRWILLGACVVAVLLCGYILGRVGDLQPYKDAATTVLSIIAQYLMVKAFMEQWYLWILVNAISVGMWIICTIRGEAYAWLMIGMWVFYLMNSINGLIQWSRKSKENEIIA